MTLRQLRWMRRHPNYGSIFALWHQWPADKDLIRLITSDYARNHNKY